MAIELDHIIVPAADRVASARLIARLLGVPWSETCNVGPFSPVYVSDELTLDFAQSHEPFTAGHFAFRVSPAEFDEMKEEAMAMGFTHAACGPFVRSSYHADMQAKGEEVK